MMMAAATAAAGAGQIGGAWIQANAAKDAAGMQADAMNRATDLQREMFLEQKRIYDQNRADLEPWRSTGVRALGDLGSDDFKRDFTQNDFQADPGYNFRMAEGQKALERSAAAKGGLNSGATLKAISRYGQDFASNEYGNAYNRFNADRDRRFGRLSSLAGIGQTANGQLMQAGSNYGAAGQNYANNAGNAYMSGANAMGASRLAQGQAWGGAVSNLGNLGMQGAWMNRSMAGQNSNTVGGGNGRQIYNGSWSSNFDGYGG
jgi:hypothetical protein